MQLSAYFDRIGFTGTAQPDLETLRRVHRAHTLTIPYENLDVQFGTPIDRSAASAFDKIVTRRRGGWCYEMNGLLSWALEQTGFTIERLAGGVMREVMGDNAVGNHLVLIAQMDEPYLVDAGFGDGLIEPIALREGAFQNGPLVCRLERIDGGWWRYHNDPRSGGPSFDFHRDIRNEKLLEGRCQFLQTDPDSIFVQNAVVQRWRDDAHLCMRGRVFQHLSASDKTTHIVNDADEYVQVLADEFGLDLPDAASLWPKICARHEVVFADAAPSA